MATADPDKTTLTQEQQVRDLVERISAYIEHYHGGNVKFMGFDGRVLKVRLGGACEGCPLSLTTLRGWVTGTIKQFFPEIEVVEDSGASIK